MAGLICPVCKSTLQEQNRESVSIDVCPQCRGVWLDRGELEKLMSVVRSDYTPPPQQTRAQPRRDYDDDDRYRHERPRHHDEYYQKDHRGYPPRKKSKMETIFDIFD